MIFNHPTIKVTIDEVQHRYFDQFQREYISCSKFLGQFYPAFEGHKIATAGAKAKLLAASVDGEIDQQELQAEVAATKQNWVGQTNRGTIIHKALEDYHDTQKCDPEFYDLAVDIHKRYLGKHRTFSEEVVFLQHPRIAGTIDKPILRKNSVTKIIDIDDFKTKNSCLIQKENPRNQYMTGPFKTLEYTDFNKHALQMSMYAFMIEKTYNYRIGSLNIIPIDRKTLKWDVVTVNYLRWEIVAAIAHYLKTQ